MEASMVSFTSGLGATLSVVAYAASLSGYLGFVFVLVLATATAIVEQQTLMKASVELDATTFEQMCQSIPAWARQTTIWGGMIFLCSCSGFSFIFLESFLENQLCPVLCAWDGDTWLCQSRWYLSLPITILIIVLNSPTELSGGLARCINVSSTIVKAVVTLAAIAKGILIWKDSTGTVPSYAAWRPLGFFRVTSILMGSLANSGTMPQLAADIKANVRERAMVWCPVIAVSLQSVVFFLAAMSGYIALGDAAGIDLFGIYAKKSPDLLSGVLQAGLATMLALGYPNCAIPCKNQAWSFVAPDGTVPLSAAPYGFQVGLTVCFSLVCVIFPMLMGNTNFGHFQVALGCTVGVWMNLLLPAVVLIYSKILPNRRATGTVDMKSVLTVGWILSLGSLCLVDGILQLVEPRGATEMPILSEECRTIFENHHREFALTPQSLQSPQLLY
eukprot:Skav229474  [mRNA]  locus=scaffold4865:14931:16265:- [translate_table: standard]